MHRFVVRVGLALGLACLGACTPAHGAFVRFDMTPQPHPSAGRVQPSLFMSAADVCRPAVADPSDSSEVRRKDAMVGRLRAMRREHRRLVT
jgi:hypothetical protein